MARTASPALSGFGARLAESRKRAGYSAAELSRLLGVNAHTVSAWEKGQSEPRSNRLLMLAGILGVSAGWLIEGDGGTLPAEARRPGEMVELRLRLENARRMVENASELLVSAEEALNSLERKIGA